MSYPTAAGDLRDFYILAGTSAATLVGLLFVGLSLHLQIVIAASEVRGLARVTPANFGAVLFVSLFMVITEDQSAAALQLIGAGIVSLIITAPTLVAAGRNQGTLEMQRLDAVNRSLQVRSKHPIRRLDRLCQSAQNRLRRSDLGGSP